MNKFNSKELKIFYPCVYAHSFLFRLVQWQDKSSLLIFISVGCLLWSPSGNCKGETTSGKSSSMGIRRLNSTMFFILPVLCVKMRSLALGSDLIWHHVTRFMWIFILFFFFLVLVQSVKIVINFFLRQIPCIQGSMTV